MTLCSIFTSGLFWHTCKIPSTNHHPIIWVCTSWIYVIQSPFGHISLVFHFRIRLNAHLSTFRIAVLMHKFSGEREWMHLSRQYQKTRKGLKMLIARQASGSNSLGPVNSDPGQILDRVNLLGPTFISGSSNWRLVVIILLGTWWSVWGSPVSM